MMIDLEMMSAGRNYGRIDQHWAPKEEGIRSRKRLAWSYGSRRRRGEHQRAIEIIAGM